MIPKNRPKLPNLKEPPRRNNLIYIVAFALIMVSFYFIFSNDKSEAEKVSLSTFINQVEQGQVKKIEVKDSKLLITLTDDKQEFTFKEKDQNMSDILANVPAEIKEKIEIDVLDTEGNAFWSNILFSIIPFLLIIGFFLFMMRQAQSSNTQALSFGKSRARLLDKEKQKTTFKDVAGAEEAKEELLEIVDFLRDPTKFTSMGAKIPKGVILIGAPGTGKTLLARAVAGEADVPFFNISGSEFVEMFVGVGASRVRDLFKKAKRNAPCIVFIDEIDAVGRQRGAGLGGGHDEREQTLNQILTEMDGFETDTNVIVMAATNRPDVLDPALLRPGRFDRRVTVDIPDIKDREKILEVHSRGKPLDKKVDLEKIARQTPGFSGADIENLMNEAAILAAKKNKKVITQKEIEDSIEKVLMGPERKSRVLSKKEKKITAYHEIGHALVAKMMKNCDPIHKVSIISRGMALGITWFMPEEDKHLYSKSKFEDEIASLLGGYITEKLIFKEVTTGASNDLERATKIAQRMVTEFGMSELGPAVWGDKHHEVFLGRDFMHTKNYSEETANKIDETVSKIIEGAYERAENVLLEYKDKLDKIAKDLIKKETLTASEFAAYFGEGKKMRKKTAAKKEKNKIEILRQ